VNELRRTPDPAGVDLRRLSALADARALDPTRPAYDPMAEFARSRGPRQLEDWEADDYGRAIWRKATESLTPDQRSALNDYTRESTSSPTCYREINGHLRGTLAATPQLDHHIHAIDAALRLVPVPETLAVVRGTAPRAFPVPVHLLAGETVTERGYLSTSIGQTPAFDNRVWMHLSVPKGTPAIFMEDVTHCPGERELLLARGLSYVVDRVDVDPTERMHVHGRILPPHTDERNGS
jgi:hypothetical protein